MVEKEKDKWGGLDLSWKGNEKHFWYRLKHKLNLVDPMEKWKKDCKGVWYS